MTATALLGISIFTNAQLELRWKQHKHIFNQYDTIWNTGIWKSLVGEIFIIFIQPYPFLNGVYYLEYDNNSGVDNAEYKVNDALLCCMVLLRSYFLTRGILRTTTFTDPRAQRVCNMYGTDASYSFALKALMKDNSVVLITSTMAFAMIIFGYTVRLFERVV